MIRYLKERRVKPGDIVIVSGTFHKADAIAGRTMLEVEFLLGFRNRRLAEGMAVVALLQMPTLEQFDVACLSKEANHQIELPPGFDLAQAKARDMKTWATAGPNRLVKVLPFKRHSNFMNSDVLYKPGLGALQWIARCPLAAQVEAVLTDYPTERYQLSPA